MKMGKRFDSDETSICAYSILKALEHLLRHDIVHGKIQPSNMLVDGFGHIVASDFGTLVYFGKKELAPFDFLLFMAPETLKREHYTQQSDIWALGISLIILLSGEHPFYVEDCTKDQLAALIAQGCVISPRIEKTLPMVADFLRMCLEVDPVKRANIAQLMQTPLIQDAIQKGVICPPNIPKLRTFRRPVASDDDLEDIVDSSIAWQLSRMKESLPHTNVLGAAAGVDDAPGVDGAPGLDGAKEDDKESNDSDASVTGSRMSDPRPEVNPITKPLSLAQYHESTLSWLAKQLDVSSKIVDDLFKLRSQEVDLALMDITLALEGTGTGSTVVSESLERLRTAVEHDGFDHRVNTKWWERPDDDKSHLTLESKSDDFSTEAPHGQHMRSVFLRGIPRMNAACELTSEDAYADWEGKSLDIVNPSSCESPQTVPLAIESPTCFLSDNSPVIRRISPRT